MHNSKNTKNIINYILFCLSLFFIILPICVNLYQLQNALKRWTNDNETHKLKISSKINLWIISNAKSFYFLCICLGSAFSAVEICNCNIFSLTLFRMGLSRRQKSIFKNERLYSIVLLENIPQLIIQLIYCIFYDINSITIMASTFSLLSIITSILEHGSTSTILKNEIVITVEIDLISPEIKAMSSKTFKQSCEYRKKKIEKDISIITHIDKGAIELVVVQKTKSGANATIHVRCNSDNKGDEIVELIQNETGAVRGGELLRAFKNGWSLNLLPKFSPIMNITHSDENGSRRNSVVRCTHCTKIIAIQIYHLSSKFG